MIMPVGSTTATGSGVTWTTSTPTTTINYPATTMGTSANQYTSNTTEFGKAFDLSTSTLHDEHFVTMVYDMALKDYFIAKKEHFPNWDELPAIKVTPSGLSSRSIGWYVQVPNDQVIDPSVKEEENLWQS